MADDERTTEPPFLKRWSQRKLAARELATPPGGVVPNAAVHPSAVEPGSQVSPVAIVESPAAPLPPVESLSFESDFTAFLKPEVDESVKRNALRKLFSDPRFNVMDGLDVYIDDYGKFEPIPPEIVATLNQARYLFNPPKTRVNEHGHVEDVPDEPDVEAAAQNAEEAPALDAAPPPIVDDATTIAAPDSSDPATLPMPPPEETR